MWRFRSAYGWRHPVRKMRRKGVRAVYRGLTPRKRHSHKSRGGVPRRPTSVSTDTDPATCGFCLLSGLGCVGAVFAAGAGLAALAYGLVALGVILGIAIAVVVSRTPRVAPSPSKVSSNIVDATRVVLESSMSAKSPTPESFRANLSDMNAEISRLGHMADLMIAELKAATRAGSSPSPEYLAAKSRFDAASDRWKAVALRLGRSPSPQSLSDLAPEFWRASRAMEQVTNEVRDAVRRLA